MGPGVVVVDGVGALVGAAVGAPVGVGPSPSRGSVAVQAATMPARTATAISGAARKMECIGNLLRWVAWAWSAVDVAGERAGVESAETPQGDDRDGDRGSEDGADDPGPLDVETAHQRRHAVEPGVDQGGQEDAAATPDERPGEDHGVAEEADDRRPPLEAGVHLAG